MEPRARAAAEAHTRRVAEVLRPLVGLGRVVSMIDPATGVGRALAESGIATQTFDPARAWRSGTLPLAEITATGCPDWVRSRPHGAEALMVAELDVEGGSLLVRDRGPIGATALAELLDELSAEVTAAHVVPWPTRAPTVAVVLGGRGDRRVGARLVDEMTAAADAEAQTLATLEARFDAALATRAAAPSADDESARITRATRDAACGEGWRRTTNRVPSRAASTIKALRVARRRPIALRRVPGQVARGLLRRHRKDRLVASPEIPDALLRLRAGEPVSTTVVVFAESPDAPVSVSAEMTGGRAGNRVVVVDAEATTSDIAEVVGEVDTDLVVFWPAGVTADAGIFDRLSDALVAHSCRMVAAPVGLLHLTELGLDLQRGRRLAHGYFAPLDDGIVMTATADVIRFEPADTDRPHIRVYDAARASGLATFVSPDVWVARDLGVMDDDNELAYLDAFGRLDEVGDETTPVDDVAVDGPAAEISDLRERVRQRCDRLSVGSASDLSVLRDVLSPEQQAALAPVWVTDEDRAPADPDDLRAPSRLEAALADLFRESHRLRDE